MPFFSLTMPPGTTETRRAMGKLVQDNLAAHFSGVALITPVV
jgi:D-3-phosphoglycerate dehydrogenase